MNNPVSAFTVQHLDSNNLLNVRVIGGVINGTAGTITVPQTTLTLTGSAMNYIFVVMASGVVGSNTTGFSNAHFPISIVTTGLLGGTQSVINIADARPDFNIGVFNPDAPQVLS